jgi:hypothetical protein
VFTVPLVQHAKAPEGFLTEVAPYALGRPRLGLPRSAGFAGGL